MNILKFDIGSGRMTYTIIQSIIRKSPIICPSEDYKKKLKLNGKAICEKLFPGNVTSMPDPITYDDLDKGNFNRSLSYILDSVDNYMAHKGVHLDSIVIEDRLTQ